ncbi:MAG: EAL domain-containing protein [Deltaproteobacteria bacterium]
MNGSKRDSILPRLRCILQNSMYMEMQALRHILDYRLISISFQPIKARPSGEIFAYQALVRGPHGSNYELPNSLFTAADYYKCRWEMEAMYLQEAMIGAADRVRDQFLFLTIDPKFMASWEYDADFILYCADRYLLPPEQIVLNIGDPGQITYYSSLRLRLSMYRKAGLKLALQDHGTGSIDQSIVKFKPDFVVLPLYPARSGPDAYTSFSSAVDACGQTGAATIFEEIWEGSDPYFWSDHKQDDAAFRVS